MKTYTGSKTTKLQTRRIRWISGLPEHIARVVAAHAFGENANG